MQINYKIGNFYAAHASWIFLRMIRLISFFKKRNKIVKTYFLIFFFNSKIFKIVEYFLKSIPIAFETKANLEANCHRCDQNDENAKNNYD